VAFFLVFLLQWPFNFDTHRLASKGDGTCSRHCANDTPNADFPLGVSLPLDKLPFFGDLGKGTKYCREFFAGQTGVEALNKPTDQNAQ
jgi:hypothetical protein